VKHNIGRAAARRNEPSGEVQMGEQKQNGTLHTGGLHDFFSLNSGVLSRHGGTLNTGGLSDFLNPHNDKVKCDKPGYWGKIR